MFKRKSPAVKSTVVPVKSTVVSANANGAPGAATGIPAEILTALKEAVQSGQYLVAVYQRKDQRIHLKRMTNGFLYGDFTTAVNLLRDDLDAELRNS